MSSPSSPSFPRKKRELIEQLKFDVRIDTPEALAALKEQSER